MSDTSHQDKPLVSPDRAVELRKLRRRYRKDFRFKMYTIVALLIAAGFLVVFLVDLTVRGVPALRQAEILADVTYSVDTLKDPQLPFQEEIRDLVSHASELEVNREGQRAKIEVLVHYGAETASRPAEAIQAVTLTADDYPEDFPEFMRDEDAVEIPREHLLVMLGEQGLENIRANIKDDPSLAGTSRRDWLRGSESLQQFLTDSTGFTPEVTKSAETLANREMLRMEFNRVKFGDGATIQKWVLATSEVDQYLKGYKYMRPENYDDPSKAKFTQEQADRVDRLYAEGKIRLSFNHYFFFRGDSRLPEAAGMKSAIIGSVYVLSLVFLVCVPIGVMTSVYLEEYAPDNFLTQTIEVNINNLAAIPSILFGVLGLAVMINFLHFPRASVMIGAAVLVLRTLPIIIITSRAALRAVPDSIRMAGFAMGATRWQVVLHHVLPASISGIMTGSIIGIAQAMGETAPLLIVGLVAFVPDAPVEPTDAATVMPALIYSWFKDSRIAFQERAALAILVLLVVLFILNGVALFIRTRAEKQW